MSVTSGPATSYTYDAMSRLATVFDGTRSASYSRVSGSSLLASTTINNGTADILSTTRTYDTLDRLTNITSNGISYDYTYDNSDKRTKNVLSDGSYWLYEYDDLGQVTKGKKYTASGVEVVGQSFGYDYDDIGNLKTENRNGNVFKYTANSVNQYTERTVPSRINISGSADASAKVTIKQGSTYTKPLRYGNYFNAFFNLDNSSNSVSDSFDIYAVKFDGTKDIVAKQTLNVFVPKTPEQFTYDNDGNMLSDGRFVYSWNAENRLVSAVETGKQKIDFIYDYMGRRINKKVYSWNGSAWVLDSETKFVYDRYNIVAEFDGSNNLLNSYLWGEDVSGSLDGAGGVGGLLAVNNYLPIYDGNGNVMSYINATNGTVCAEYQYNPFGKIISKSGTNADSFKMLFSTKYHDKETETFYYLYRDYKPETSRWLSRDPIGEKGGTNIYYFIGNDAINKWDYLGLQEGYIPLPGDPVFDSMPLEKEIREKTIKEKKAEQERKIEACRTGFCVVATTIDDWYGALVSPLGVDHVDLTYNGVVVIVGLGGDEKRRLGKKYIVTNNVYKLTIKKSGKFQYGPANVKGCPCKNATDKDVLDCLNDRKLSQNKTNLNCQGHIKKSVDSCCLKGFDTFISEWFPTFKF